MSFDGKNLLAINRCFNVRKFPLMETFNKECTADKALTFFEAVIQNSGRAGFVSLLGQVHHLDPKSLIWGHPAAEDCIPMGYFPTIRPSGWGEKYFPIIVKTVRRSSLMSAISMSLDNGERLGVTICTVTNEFYQGYWNGKLMPIPIKEYRAYQLRIIEGKHSIVCFSREDLLAHLEPEIPHLIYCDAVPTVNLAILHGSDEPYITLAALGEPKLVQALREGGTIQPKEISEVPKSTRIEKDSRETFGDMS